MFDRLVKLDRLQVIVIVDNESDGLSPPCRCCDTSATPAADRAAKYTSEVSHAVGRVRAGAAACLDWSSDICFAGHGYSLLLEAEVDGKCHRLLFDGGPSTELWRRNAAILEVPVGDIEAAVLSHWHIDHSVGLLAAAEDISKARSTQPAAADAASPTSAAGTQLQQAAAVAPRPPVIFDLHSRRPHRMGLQFPNQEVIPWNMDPELSALQQPGIELQLHDQPHTLLDDCFYVSGFIPRMTPYETGNPNHASQWEAGGAWESDEAIADERYVAAAVRGKGLVVFSACSHAGIVNVMRDVQQQTGKGPYAVFGGFHLAPRDLAPRIEPTIQDVLALGPALVVAGHCTGWHAKTRLAVELQERFMPSFVGARFSIPAAVDADDQSRGGSGSHGCLGGNTQARTLQS